MILGIDAANIRRGGGLTHLRELLKSASPSGFGFSRVDVWATPSTLEQLPSPAWLRKCTEPALAGGLLSRMRWQISRLGDICRDQHYDMVFVPGGSFVTTFRPIVTMSQNLLPFRWGELSRYGLSLMTLKMLALRQSQSRSFRAASGTIFLTDAAKEETIAVCGPMRGESATIPHGIDWRFRQTPRPARPLSSYSESSPFSLVYVSVVEPYKHQWVVVEAVAKLRSEGMPVTLDLVGPANPKCMPRLQRALDRFDPYSSFIRYRGAVPHEELHNVYGKADACVFASSCETIANILIEGMASGLATACADRGPLREVLGDGGVYFDPEDAASIAHSLRELIESADLRAEKADISFRRANQYSWQRCADETFSFLASLATRQPAL